MVVITCFVFNRGGIYPRRSPDKGVRPNHSLLVWVTNVSTSPDLYIEFSTDPFVHEAINSEHQISHGMANPLLESFGKSPKVCVINSSHPPTNLKGKENPDLPSACSNYWLVQTTGLHRGSQFVF